MSKWLQLVFATVFSISIQAQSVHNPIPKNYSVDMQRLLIVATGQFIYGSRQGDIDLDSAMLLAAKIFRLNRLLAYTDGYTIDVGDAALLDQNNTYLLRKKLESLRGVPAIQLNALLGIYYLFKAGDTKSDLDSARFFLQNARYLSGRSASKTWEKEATRLLGMCAFQAGDANESQRLFTALADVCRRDKDSIALATALLSQAACTPIGAAFKIPMLEEASAIFQNLGKEEKVIEAQYAVVLEYFFTASSLTIEKLQRLLTLHAKLGFIHQQYIHNTLAYLFIQKADIVKSVAHAQAAVNSMEVTKDSAFGSIYCYRLGSILYYSGRKQEGEYWSERAFTMPKTTDNQVFWYPGFLGKINILLLAHQPQAALNLTETTTRRFPPETVMQVAAIHVLKGMCYQALQQPGAAKEQYQAFIAITEKLPPAFLMDDVVTALPNIGLFYFDERDYANAKNLLQRSLAVQPGKFSVSALSAFYLLHFKIDSLEGRNDDAIRHYQHYKQISDSAFGITEREKLNELMIRYETAKKDQDIQMLKQESEIQENKLKQSDFTMKMAFGGVALLAIIVILLYNQYRLKQRAGKETEERNRALQKLLNEKEWLLKEVHHRVKNNLQTVVSLLESQSAYLSNDALLAVQDSQNRIYAMSLIHQKLYLGQNVASINMAGYLPQLVHYLRESFDTRQRIQFRLQIDDIELDVSQAVPIGLILNEAITNAIKYAFSNMQPDNTVHISMKEMDDDMVHLLIADNGAGLPEPFHLQNSGGLGLRLMRGLTGDIEGTFDIKNENGTTVSVIFKANKPLHTTGDIAISKLLGNTA